MTEPSFYDLLGVPKSASAAVIRQAYRRLAQRLHPDVNPNDPTASSRFAMLAQAYRTLSDPVSRSHYDLSLGGVHDLPPTPSVPSPQRQRKDNEINIPLQVPMSIWYRGGEVSATGWVRVPSPACQGTGCHRCEGLGQRFRKRKWVVQLPAYHPPSLVLCLARAGHHGPAFVEAGDVYLAVRPASAHGWRWSESHGRVERTVWVPWWWFRAGGVLELKAPLGEKGVVQIPASQGWATWVRVLGLGSRGEPAWLHVRVGLWFSWGTRRAPKP